MEKINKFLILVFIGLFLMIIFCPLSNARLIRDNSIRFIPGTNIEIIGQQKFLPDGKPVIAVFDVHGTLLKSTWKSEYVDTYQECTGRNDGKSWVEENTLGKSRSEVFKLISEISDFSPVEVEEIFRNFYEHYRADNLSEAMPCALDMIRSLVEKGIPVVAVSGTAREIVLKQLEQTGFLDYIRPENIIGARNIKEGINKNINRSDIFRVLQEEFSDYALVYFDDWVRGVDTVIKSDGVIFGIPQGRKGAEEWMQNRNLLISAGTNYILNGWFDYEYISNLFTDSNIESFSFFQKSLQGLIFQALSKEKATVLPDSESIMQFVQANTGRDYTIYTGSMGAATVSKANIILDYFPDVEEGDIIVDAGSGTGELAELIASEFHGTHVYAEDISHDLLEYASDNQALIELVFGDAQEQNFPENSVKVKYYSTSGHEIESFGGSMQRAMENTFIELKSGGRVIVRDFVIPSRKEWVYMKINSTPGLNKVSEGTKSEDIDYNLLSTRALFDRFYQEFQGGGVFKYESIIIDGEEYIKIRPEWAYEFYMRKDYTANWRNEIKEKYGYWTLEKARKVLKNAGYTNIQVDPEYNDWIRDNRLKGQIELYEEGENGKLHPIELFPTHMLVTGDKPGDVVYDVETTGTLPDVVDYKDIFSTIAIDEDNGIVRIGEKEFSVDIDSLIIGTKKLIFHLTDTPGYVLKVVRSDTRNDHNVFKSMHQIINRQSILDDFNVPHLKIEEADENGPPYRYVIQEAMPEEAVCAADLILESKLTEADVFQIAEIVNRFEKSKQWQLDMNPYSWFRVKKADGTTQMVYASGKVYLYDEKWEFRRIGLMQWIDKKYVENAINYNAVIPTQNEYQEFFNENWLGSDDRMIELWKRFLDFSIQPVGEIRENIPKRTPLDLEGEDE